MKKFFGFKKNTGPIALVSRSDLFPTNHGAAVKIVFTAKGISYYQDTMIITQSNDCYYQFHQGLITKSEYPFFIGWAFYIPQKFLRKIIEKKGIPMLESWLYTPKIDLNFKVRVLYLALKYQISALQPEFPGYFDACFWAKHFLGIQTAMVEHNIEFDRLQHQFQLTPAVYDLVKEWELTVCKNVDLIITVSEDDKQILVRHGAGGQKIKVIPHGVDLESFQVGGNEIAEIRNAYGVSAQETLLIFHGVLAYGPNHQAVGILRNEIWPRLKNKGYDIKFFIVGRYPPFEFGGENFIFTDAVDKLAPYIFAADIAVVPLLAGGGTRLKILEYFAASIPVICTAKACEGIPVESGRELIITDDYDQMVAEIIKMIDNKTWRKQIGENGNRFVQKLDWKKIGLEYFHLYQNIGSS
ncbi:MAG: glycosyltransferase family 4 protein [Firmicutes bacterium]|nr:glycosyltransferase family 4 protein [Bacillota bacterium]